MQMPAPQTFAMPPPPQVWSAGQDAPQWSVPPQPSLVEPQSAPRGTPSAACSVVTHWPVIPLAPQVWLDAQPRS